MTRAGNMENAKPLITLPWLVARGAHLDAKIKSLNEELKDIKAQLVKAGAGEHLSPDGEKALVIFPSPSIKPGDAVIADAKFTLPTAAFGKLFERIVVMRPRKGFREIAAAILSPAKAAKLIASCEVESTPQVRFSI